MTKEDFRIVQTASDKFHIEKRVIETTYSFWGKREDVVKWMRCDSEGGIFWATVNHVYPSLPLAEKQIGYIVENNNTYPVIHTL